MAYECGKQLVSVCVFRHISNVSQFVSNMFFSVHFFTRSLFPAAMGDVAPGVLCSTCGEDLKTCRLVDLLPAFSRDF